MKEKQIILEKLAYLREQYIIASDASQKFTLKKQIEELEQELMQKVQVYSYATKNNTEKLLSETFLFSILLTFIIVYIFFKTNFMDNFPKVLEALSKMQLDSPVTVIALLIFTALFFFARMSVIRRYRSIKNEKSSFNSNESLEKTIISSENMFFLLKRLLSILFFTVLLLTLISIMSILTAKNFTSNPTEKNNIQDTIFVKESSSIDKQKNNKTNKKNYTKDISSHDISLNNDTKIENSSGTQLEKDINLSPEKQTIYIVLDSYFKEDGGYNKYTRQVEEWCESVVADYSSKLYRLVITEKTKIPPSSFYLKMDVSIEKVNSYNQDYYEFTTTVRDKDSITCFIESFRITDIQKDDKQLIIQQFRPKVTSFVQKLIQDDICLKKKN